MKKIKIGNFVALMVACVMAFAGFACGSKKSADITDEQDSVVVDTIVAVDSTAHDTVVAEEIPGECPECGCETEIVE